MKLKLHWQILTALALSLLIVFLIRTFNCLEANNVHLFVSICQLLGQLFMNGLKMIMVPLICASIITAILGTSVTEGKLGRLTFKTLAFYTITGLGGAATGMLTNTLLRPGDMDPFTAQAILGISDYSLPIARNTAKYTQDLIDIFLRIAPPNIIQAASDNTQIIGMIVFSFIFGYCATKLPKNQQDLQKTFWESILSIMLQITQLIIKFAAIGVFCLITPVFLRTGIDLIYPILRFFLAVLAGLGFYFFILMPLLLRFVGRVQVIKHYKAMLPVLLTAFSTASSTAALPVALDVMKQESGISNRIANFVLPLGINLNMAGTALYGCIVVLFIAGVFHSVGGEALSFNDQILVVVLCWVSSLGVAGVPASSLLSVTLVLGIMGLPVEALGIIWVTDRILDMCRTTVNVFTNTVGAILIDRSEGNLIVYRI
jgi:proton glutamate symport protein